LREKEILAAALRLSQASLLMLDSGLADIAANEPSTVQRESLNLLRRLIAQTAHAADWALNETAHPMQHTAH